MKITPALEGKRVRKKSWAPGIWEKVVYVGNDSWAGEHMDGKEFIMLINPHDDEYIFYRETKPEI